MQSTRLSNKEIVERLIEAGNKPDMDMETIRALIAPGAAAHMLFDATDSLTGEKIGREEEFSAELLEKRVAYEQKMFTDELATVDMMLDVGEDMVLTISTNTATHKSGKKVSTQSIGIDRIADGQVVESWYLWDRLGYWQQLGLVPPTSELLKKLEAM